MPLPRDRTVARTTYGRSGIEAAANKTLTGRRSFDSWRDAVTAAAGLPVPGNDIRLTIDSDVQRASEEAIAGYHTQPPNPLHSHWLVC